jgi:hypothetical protein
MRLMLRDLAIPLGPCPSACSAFTFATDAEGVWPL